MESVENSQNKQSANTNKTHADNDDIDREFRIVIIAQLFTRVIT